MNKFGVNREKEEALILKMKELGIEEADIEERFIRSGGPGGQNVNKVSTCVQLMHKPSGLIVKSQENRAQGINRFLARRLLVEKIEERILGRKSKKQIKSDKIKKQKKRRKRRTGKKLLTGQFICHYTYK